MRVDARQNAHESYSSRERAGKREERRVRNLAPSWGPQVLHKCCEENRENSDGSVSASLFAKDEKSMSLGARGALAPVWGRDSKVVSKTKTLLHEKPLPFWKPFSNYSRISHA